MRHAVVALALLALATGAPAAPDPTRPGRLAVGVTTVDAVDAGRGNRTLPTEIWYPPGARNGTRSRSHAGSAPAMTAPPR